MPRPMTTFRLIAPWIVALAGAASGVAAAQTLQAPSIGEMSATQVGAEPAMKVPTARYVAETDGLDAWVVAASRLAINRSRDEPLLGFARIVGETHMAALRQRGGMGAIPPAWAERLARLRAARGADFDRLFIADQIAAHRRLWSLHAGYAVDGADPRLKRDAAADVSLEERAFHDLPMRPMPY